MKGHRNGLHARAPSRDAQGGRLVDDLGRDLRLAVRTFVRQPGFVAVSALTLALGIGANTAIFSLIQGVVLRALPVRAPDRLVLSSDSLFEGTQTGEPPQGRWELFSSEIYESLRTDSPSVEALAAFGSGEDTVSVRMPGRARSAPVSERARAHLVSGRYFSVIGMDAALGRSLAAEDDRPNAMPVAVVSDGFWRQRLGADPNVVGRVAILNDTAFTVVGVMPGAFFGEHVRRAPDFWVPLVYQPQIELRLSYLMRSDAYWLTLIGRLAPNQTRDAAQTALTLALRRRLTTQAGTDLTDATRRQIQSARVELVSGAGGISEVRQRYGQPLAILLGVVALVLLIACANVGNLLLARATARQSEMAVRRALGATRGRLVRQLLAESLLLSALGAVGGVLLARWVVAVLLALFVSKSTPVEATVSGPVLAFTIAVTLVAAVLFGLAPALRAGRAEPLPALRSGGRGSQPQRRVLGIAEPFVILQIAVSLVLAVGASLFARSLLNLEHEPLGFEQDQVLLARINPRLAGYTPAQAGALYRRLYDRLVTVPGVERATLARYSPLSGARSTNSATVDGYVPLPGEHVSIESVLVGPTYPQTLGMPIVGGRAIGLEDGPGAAKVAMVNEAFVRHFSPNGSPLGHHFQFGPSDDYEIVGIIKDAQFHDARDAVAPVAFLAMFQDSSQKALDCEIEVRGSGDSSVLTSRVRQAVAEVDRGVTVGSGDTLRARVMATFSTTRLAAEFIGVFAGLALLLAAIGLYGVVAYAVARRMHEIGVRVALGAARRDVLWLILRDTLVRLAIGLGFGLLASIGAGRVIASQLFGVTAGDPASFVLAATVLATVAMATSLVPAFHALGVDPITALRSE